MRRAALQRASKCKSCRPDQNSNLGTLSAVEVSPRPLFEFWGNTDVTKRLIYVFERDGRYPTALKVPAPHDSNRSLRFASR
jgi:hypothetical protein